METSEPSVYVIPNPTQRFWWLVASIILMPSAERYEKMSVMIPHCELICSVQLICCAWSAQAQSCHLKCPWARYLGPVKHISKYHAGLDHGIWSRCSFISEEQNGCLLDTLTIDDTWLKLLKKNCGVCQCVFVQTKLNKAMQTQKSTGKFHSL